MTVCVIAGTAAANKKKGHTFVYPFPSAGHGSMAVRTKGERLVLLAQGRVLRHVQIVDGLQDWVRHVRGQPRKEDELEHHLARDALQ